jgi:hypothetical protein
MVVAIQGIHEKPGGTQDRRDAMPWKVVLPTDLPALKSPVAGEKALAKGVSFIENHWQVMIVIVQPEARTEQNQG